MSAAATPQADSNASDPLLAYFVNGSYLPNKRANADYVEYSGRLAIIFISLLCLAGAVVESTVKHTRIMYTVVMFVFGCAAKLLSTTMPSFGQYLIYFQSDPHTTLNMFLPVLVFEAAFATDSHVFQRSLGQLLILALPGFAIAAMMSAVVARYVLPYGWDWNIAMAFGAVLSCTDPTALVTSLKELGIDQKLIVLLKGEALLNDGSTMVMYYVFLELARGSYISHAGAFFLFLRVTFGGVLIGLVFGKFCTYWMGLTYNNFIQEIIITITFPYITYYVADSLLGVSGLLAVMILGLFLSSRRTCITPDVDKYLRRTWKILAFIAQTLIFVLVGVEVLQGITEAGLHRDVHYGFDDLIYIVILYFAALGIRGLMLLVLSPFLRLVGYGFNVSTGAVLLWGGLRGCVALTLAIFVAQDSILDNHTVGSKFLFHIAGMVLLSLIINGSSMQSILRIIGLTDVSEAKLTAMRSVVAKLATVQANTVSALKNDRFLADTNWDVVLKNSAIYSPYKKFVTHKCNSQRRESQCPKCRQGVQAELTPQEFSDLENEIRLSYLNAEKISYWRQYEQGMISADAVLRLVDLTETEADRPSGYVTVEKVMPLWRMTGVYSFLPRLNKCLEGAKRSYISRPSPPEGEDSVRRKAYNVAISLPMKWIMCFVTLAHLSVNVTDSLLYFSQGVNLAIEFDVLSWLAAAAFWLEVAIKVVGLGCRGYFYSHSNIIAFVVAIVIGPVDVAVHAATGMYTWLQADLLMYNRTWSIALRYTTALRLAEVVTEICLPYLLLLVQTAIEQKLNLGYDVGRGYVTCKEECHHLIDQMTDNHAVRDKLKSYSDKNKFSVIKELAIIQRENPGVAGAIKVRQATRAVLNKMKEDLQKYKEDGLIEESEAEKLLKIMDQRVKMLLSAPPTIAPMPPMQALKFVPWLQNVEDRGVDDFVRQRVQVLNFDHGDIIMNTNEPAHGIYVVVSGLVKVVGKNKIKAAIATKEKGDGDETAGEEADMMTDYVTAGAILGELEVLSGRPMSATVQAETAAKLYAFGRRDLDLALTIFPSIKRKLWRSVAINLVSTLADELRLFQMFSAEMRKVEIEKGYLLDLDGLSSYTLQPTIAHAFLINGRITVEYRDGGSTVIDRPCRIPSDSVAIRFLSGADTVVYCLPAEEAPLLCQAERSLRNLAAGASRVTLRRPSGGSRLSLRARGGGGARFQQPTGHGTGKGATASTTDVAAAAAVSPATPAAGHLAPRKLKSLPAFLRNPFVRDWERRTQSEQKLPQQMLAVRVGASVRPPTVDAAAISETIRSAAGPAAGAAEPLPAPRESRFSAIAEDEAHLPPAVTPVERFQTMSTATPDRTAADSSEDELSADADSSPTTAQSGGGGTQRGDAEPQPASQRDEQLTAAMTAQPAAASGRRLGPSPASSDRGFDSTSARSLSEVQTERFATRLVSEVMRTSRQATFESLLNHGRPPAAPAADA